MNKKQWKTFGFVFSALAIIEYLYTLLMIDFLGEIQLAIQRLTFFLLLGLSIAFFICAKLESKKV